MIEPYLIKNRRTQLASLVVLTILFTSCASFGTTKPNIPYSGNPHPAILKDLTIKNPLLVKEIGKLPEIQDGISPQDEEALKKLCNLYNENSGDFEKAFAEMYQVGIPEVRKYCSPLQALFWLLEDGKEGQAQKIMSEFYASNKFNLERLLEASWSFKITDEKNRVTLSEEQILKIAQDYVVETDMGSHRQSRISSYRKNVQSYFDERNNDKKKGILEDLGNIIHMDYGIDKKRFTKAGREIIEAALPKQKDPRWSDFYTVADRLNDPLLVIFYTRYNFLYKPEAIKEAQTPKETFYQEGGVCRHYSSFATECGVRSGHDMKNLTVCWGSGWDEGHTVGIERKPNTDLYKIVIDSRTLRIGEYKSLEEIKRYVSGGKKITFWSLETNGELISRIRSAIN